MNFNLNKDSHELMIYFRKQINSKKFDWENDSWAVAQYYPEMIDPERYN